MGIRLFLKQQQRNLMRTLPNILLLTAAVAFFVTSMDLYINSIFEISAYLFGDKYFEKAEAILATDFIYYKAFISN